MNAFWQNLAHLAQGQLFAGGYLSPATVTRLVADRQTRKQPCDDPRQRKVMPWPRLAAYR
jgi:hypothetical protein